MELIKLTIPKLRERLHQLMSLYIRRATNQEFKGCMICIYTQQKLVPIQDCFHFIKRQHSIVTWEPLNLTGSCKRCNFSHNYNPERAWNVFIRLYGQEAMDMLVEASRHPAKFTRDDLISRYSYWKDKMEKNITFSAAEKIRRVQAIVEGVKERELNASSKLAIS